MLLGVALLLSGCGPGLVFNNSQQMTPDQMLARADLVFVGVIEKQHFDPWLFFRAPETAERAKCWAVLRREVRVEMVLRGAERRKKIDVYEIFWICGASGDWNATYDGDRNLFLVRVENGRYHVVRDWWRSIFPITTGPHRRLPLADSRPLWERIALMNWQVQTDRIEYPRFLRADPGNVFTQWRTVKLLRGLVRHPSSQVRVAACRELATSGWGQDECWDSLTERERAEIGKERPRQGVTRTSFWDAWSREERRLLTAVSDRRLRAEFCRMWEREYPGDRDNGCPADQPPPATIVTDKGDVPLIGPWPK